jgi:hypothetical protein
MPNGGSIRTFHRAASEEWTPTLVLAYHSSDFPRIIEALRTLYTESARIRDP